MRDDRGAGLFSRSLPAALLILAVAIATRVVTYGNPLTDMDDQFYWLVGRSMWNGDWPVLDIWDRKPVGLFLIFGAITGISNSIVAMQLAATVFAAATAWTVRWAALTFARPAGATMAGLAYLLVLPSFGGQSGQSPIFYNLFIAGAGALLLSVSGSSDRNRIRHCAFWAIALSGLALVVKQVSVAEGTFFGLAFLRLLHREGESWRRLASGAATMIGLALLPTLAAFALFATRGGDAVAAYGYAAYISNFAKTKLIFESRLAGVEYLLLFMLALIVFAGLGAITRRRGGTDPVRQRLIPGWIIASLAGYLLVPNFFPHYALPLIVPLAISAASAFDRPAGRLLFAALAAFALIQGDMTNLARNRSARLDFDAAADRVETARQGGCIYLVNGPAALYAVSPACRTTRYLFPYHLTLASEAGAIGIDQRGEVRRIFDSRPAVVVTQDSQRPNHSRDVEALVAERLARDYRIVASVSPNADPDIATLRIWQRSDLPPPTN
ncbi:MAG: hypothetical protein H0W65_07965 [Sphingomonas sp.]|uniref:hypothetical protein n=1 Tax=Sphingomonas sp. TaxID=28214 RepID=UPI0017E85B7F|nr:hypothetical protein [Sphingomonas sp.]MBA3667642.1 hypothetical protein [Sphingomonas sp.]